ncbi:hypothetical protein SAMN05421677_10214 [Halobacillus aidingensis]|uniref:Uncharacterized protein n=1 Tax=Halobacillus aidingensis TaxID=240303 RepID=A0A1H0FI32_HALAD|nr:hypothetical protein SAMN05421677_10214 [Halobacillus aidingensis]
MKKPYNDVTKHKQHVESHRSGAKGRLPFSIKVMEIILSALLVHVFLH